MNATMTKGEREELRRLVGDREKNLKDAAKLRSAELLADFENQIGQSFSFDQVDTSPPISTLGQRLTCAAPSNDLCDFSSRHQDAIHVWGGMLMPRNDSSPRVND